MKHSKCAACKVISAAARSLSRAELQLLEHNSVSVDFKRGELIFKQGSFSLNIAYLRSGIAKIHMTGLPGERILRIVRAPAYLGLVSALGDRINQFSATALEEATVCFIDASVFKEFICSNGKFGYEIIEDLCRNELFDHQRYTLQSQKRVPGVIAETLLCLADKIYGRDQFVFPLTRRELGDMVGTSRETVSRVLSGLARDRIIDFADREFTILDKKRLKQISEKG